VVSKPTIMLEPLRYLQTTATLTGAYKFAEIKFPEFSRFYKLSLPDNYKLKTQYYKSA